MIRGLLVALLATSGCGAADWGPETWQNLNPGGGGNIQAVDLDPTGLLGERGEHRPRLEAQPVTLAAEGTEVVPVEQDVDAHLFQLGGGVSDLLVGSVLRGDLHADAHVPMGHVTGNTRPPGSLPAASASRRIVAGMGEGATRSAAVTTSAPASRSAARNAVCTDNPSTTRSP